MRQFEVSVIIKTHNQISIDANDLEEAINKASQKAMIEFNASVGDVEIVEVQESFV